MHELYCFSVISKVFEQAVEEMALIKIGAKALGCQTLLAELYRPLARNQREI